MGLKIDWIKGEVTTTPPTPASVTSHKSLAAAGDYAAEDVLSESATVGSPFVFQGVVRRAGGAFRIEQAVALLSTTALAPRITLYLFNALPTSALNDNVANTAVLTADRERYVGRIEFPAMVDLGGNSEAYAMLDTGANLPMQGLCNPKDTSIYGIAVTEDPITGEVAGMTLQFKLFVRPG